MFFYRIWHACRCVYGPVFTKWKGQGGLSLWQSIPHAWAEFRDSDPEDLRYLWFLNRGREEEVEARWIRHHGLENDGPAHSD